MIGLLRGVLCAATLFPASSLLADDGDVRVAVVVDMTPEGRKFAHPTPDHPAYYLPVTLGYQEVGGHLTNYQRPPPPADKVQRLLANTLAAEGYRVATQESPPSLVLVFRWGYIAPMIVMGQWGNRNEMMTYIAGDNWPDTALSSSTESQELVSSVDVASGSAPGRGPYGHPSMAPLSTVAGVPPNSSDTTNSSADLKSRYFLLVSALDFQAFQQHKSVLLWRAHVSINTWGHYLDETLPTLIAAGAPMFGRETNQPQIVTAPVVPLGHVVVGAPMLAKEFQGVPTAPIIVSSERLQADTDKTLTQFAEGAESDMMEPAGPATTQNGQTSAPETPREESSDRVVRLPPYIVTDSISRIRWQYAAIRGVEILSCSGTAVTENFAETLYRQKAWLDEMVPPNLQWSSTVPTTVILLNEHVKREMSGAIASLARANAEQMSRKPAERGVLDPESPSSDLLPQVQLSDDDSIGVDIVLNDQPGHIAFDPHFVFFLLTNHVPALPPWFAAGMARLYQDRTDAALDHSTSPRTAREIPGAPPGGNPFSNDQDKLLYFPPFSEMSGGDTLPPMQAMLNGPPAAGPDGGNRELDVWVAQSVLFVRWALDDATGKRREALWDFVGRTGGEPPTEATFKRCFGMGFAGMHAQLADYLWTAASRPFALVPKAPLDSPWVEPRDPTEAEEARILGDWQRKEIEFVRPTHPEYAGKYTAQANHTLMRAYDDGARDPGLLAALGLYECAVGADDLAQNFLEGAVQARVARPRAYVELARIRLAAALAKPTGSRGRLDRGQVGSVLSLLHEAHALQPPQFGAFLLACEAWEHADFVPTPADLRMLDEGLYLFPGDPRLVLAAAQLDARAGLRIEAIQVLDRGLQKVDDTGMRNLFVTLRTRYAAGPNN